MPNQYTPPLHNLAQPNIHHTISTLSPSQIPQTLTPPSQAPPPAQPPPSPWPTNPPTTDLASLPSPALTPSDFFYISSRCRGTSRRGRSCRGDRRGLRGGIGCRRWGAIYGLCLWGVEVSLAGVGVGVGDGRWERGRTFVARVVEIDKVLLPITG